MTNKEAFDQYTSPVPPTELYNLGYNEAIAFNPAVPLFAEQQIADNRNISSCKVLADVSFTPHFSNTPYEISLIEANLPRRSTGEVENVLLMRRLYTDQQGNKAYREEDSFVEVPNGQTTITDEQIAKLGLPSNLGGKIWLSRNPENTSVNLTNMSENTNVSTTISAGALRYVEQDKSRQPVVFEVPERQHEYTMHADKVREGAERPQIGKGRRIEGGEYTTALFDEKTGRKIIKGEIIVVDTQRDPADTKLYSDLKAEVIKRANKKQGLGVLSSLYAIDSVSRETIPYSYNNEVDDLLKRIIPDGNGGIKNGGKVDLAYFVAEGVGVCRHQALLAGKLAEMMIDNYELSGTVSVERNELWNPIKGERAGHAWVRFTDAQGEIYIIDVAQNFVGKLSDAKFREGGWNYLRPEESGQQVKGGGISKGSVALSGALV